MAVVFQRRLALPLWAVVALVAVAVTAPPPATLFLIAVLGIAVIAFITPGLGLWLRTSQSWSHGRSQRRRQTRRAAIAVAAATSERTLDEPNGNTAQEAIDLVRTDDGEGWRVAQPGRRGRHG